MMFIIMLLNVVVVITVFICFQKATFFNLCIQWLYLYPQSVNSSIGYFQNPLIQDYKNKKENDKIKRNRGLPIK